MSTPKISIYQLSSHTDSRGSISFSNQFSLDKFKRFYILKASNPFQIRAWQGHLKEEKVFLPLSGTIKLVLLPILDLNNKAIGQPIVIELNSRQPQLVHIPGGYINGFQFLEVDSQMMIFSNFSLEESRDDDYRFDPKEFFDWHK